jgi:uncharacterized protein (DUF697 family)
MRRTLAKADAEAHDIVNNWVIGAAATGWIPFSAFFLAAADMLMIRQVADKFGIGVFDEAAVKAHLSGIIGSSIGSALAAEVLGWIPGVGWAGKSAGTAAKAKLIGEAVIDYFKENSPLSP